MYGECGYVDEFALEGWEKVYDGAKEGAVGSNSGRGLGLLRLLNFMLASMITNKWGKEMRIY